MSSSWQPAGPAAQSRRSSFMYSASAASGRSAAWPSARRSNHWVPTPSPSTKRPPLSSSTAAAPMAIRAGWRKPMLAIEVAIVAEWVAPATAAASGRTSLYDSVNAIVPNPRRSARAASAATRRGGRPVMLARAKPSDSDIRLPP